MLNRFIEVFRRELRGRLRIWLGWGALIVLIPFIWRDPTIEGVLLIFFGASIRVWASGYIEKESRLCTDGPFRFSRNPLYLGSLLMTVGAFVSQRFFVGAFVALVASLLVYRPLILAEEAVLREKFGREFEDYCARTGRFLGFPSIGKSFFSGFSFKLFRKNSGWEPITVASFMVVSLLVVHELKEYWFGGQPFDLF